MRHYELVEGRALPARLSGHRVLDFTNTRAGWNGGVQKDYLASYEHLAVWAGYVELLTAERVASLRAHAAAHPTAAAAALARACEVRTLIYEALGAEKIDPLAEAVQGRAGSLRLAATANGIEWQVDPAAGLAAPVDAVLWSAAQLLTAADCQRVRSCPGRGCGWLFIDRSGRRRWCTMATCGNREKARRFAQRRQVGN